MYKELAFRKPYDGWTTVEGGTTTMQQWIPKIARKLGFQVFFSGPIRKFKVDLSTLALLFEFISFNLFFYYKCYIKCFFLYLIIFLCIQDGFFCTWCFQHLVISRSKGDFFIKMGGSNSSKMLSQPRLINDNCELCASWFSSNPVSQPHGQVSIVVWRLVLNFYKENH